jgi:two-component system, NtrC family, response regulator HydG
MTVARSDQLAAIPVRVFADSANVLQSTEDAAGRIRQALRLARSIVPYDCAALLLMQANLDPEFIVEPASCEDAALRQLLARTFNTLAEQHDASSEAAFPAPWVSRLAVPLIGLDCMIGMLFVGATAAGAYGEQDLGVLSVVAGQLGAYLTMLDLCEERTRLTREVEHLRAETDSGAVFQHIIGRSEAVRRLVSLIRLVAPSDATVLIQGESGTGKELAARAIHALSARRARPFIAINCGALPETLLESELFGHVRGAFTGAIRNKKGLLEEAHGGTLLLDEIGDTTAAFQPKLLRMLQHGEVRPVGSSRTVRVDARVIAATNKDLTRQIELGHFRDDLYYRLAVVRLAVPPLRERKEDIPLLAEHFLKHYCAKHRRPSTRLAPQALAQLVKYQWPGNVRELENRIESAVLLSPGPVLPAKSLFAEPPAEEEEPQSLEGSIRAAKEILEKEKIAEAMQRAGGNRSQAARLLRITRATLYNKLKLYGFIESAPQPKAR